MAGAAAAHVRFQRLMTRSAHGDPVQPTDQPTVGGDELGALILCSIILR